MRIRQRLDQNEIQRKWLGQQLAQLQSMYEEAFKQLDKRYRLITSERAYRQVEDVLKAAYLQRRRVHEDIYKNMYAGAVCMLF